jgi:hypothetical protein
MQMHVSYAGNAKIAGGNDKVVMRRQLGERCDFCATSGEIRVLSSPGGSDSKNILHGRVALEIQRSQSVMLTNLDQAEVARTRGVTGAWTAR